MINFFLIRFAKTYELESLVGWLDHLGGKRQAGKGKHYLVCSDSIRVPVLFQGVVRFYVGIRVCDASTPRPHPVSRQSSSPADPAEYPARAARQWIPPSIAPELLARAARKWIPPSIPPELLASGSRPVSRQSCSPVDVSRQSGSPVDPAEYPAAKLMGIWSRSP